MAFIAKSGSPSLSTVHPSGGDRLPALPTGEDTFPGDACYINPSDGKVYRSVGGSGGATGSGVVDGYATVIAKAAQRATQTLYKGVVFNYGSGLTPGVNVYLDGATPGGLNTTPGTAQTVDDVTVTNGGTGYTSAPTVAFSGGAGTGAAATAVVTNGVVTAVNVTNVGSGYTSAPTVAFSGGGGSGAAATAVVGAAVNVQILGRTIDATRIYLRAVYQ